jgi:hypothetical protein
MSVKTNKCNAVTSTGAKCTRNAKSRFNYCWQHLKIQDGQDENKDNKDIINKDIVNDNILEQYLPEQIATILEYSGIYNTSNDKINNIINKDLLRDLQEWWISQKIKFSFDKLFEDRFKYYPYLYEYSLEKYLNRLPDNTIDIYTDLDTETHPSAQYNILNSEMFYENHFLKSDLQQLTQIKENTEILTSEYYDIVKNMLLKNISLNNKIKTGDIVTYAYGANANLPNVSFIFQNNNLYYIEGFDWFSKIKHLPIINDYPHSNYFTSSFAFNESKYTSGVYFDFSKTKILEIKLVNNFKIYITFDGWTIIAYGNVLDLHISHASKYIFSTLKKANYDESDIRKYINYNFYQTDLFDNAKIRRFFDHGFNIPIEYKTDDEQIKYVNKITITDSNAFVDLILKFSNITSKIIFENFREDVQISNINEIDDQKFQSS